MADSAPGEVGPTGRADGRVADREDGARRRGVGRSDVRPERSRRGQSTLPTMTRTVHELRNDIRESVGRYERIESTGFTKEALAAICEAVAVDIDTTGRLPPKSEMRADILDAIDEPTDDEMDRSFRKAELQAIAAAVE